MPARKGVLSHRHATKVIQNNYFRVCFQISTCASRSHLVGIDKLNMCTMSHMDAHAETDGQHVRHSLRGCNRTEREEIQQPRAGARTNQLDTFFFTGPPMCACLYTMFFNGCYSKDRSWLLSFKFGEAYNLSKHFYLPACGTVCFK
jgi:hypothetical protein